MAGKPKQTQEQLDRAARIALQVPAHARENYVAMVRNHAEQSGLSLEDAKARQVTLWRLQHDSNPVDGYSVLADWLEDADLDSHEYAPAVPDPAAVERVRAVEAAKREYDATLDGFTDAERADILRHRGAVRESVTETGTE